MTPRRRLFWPLIAAAIACFVLASSSLAIALFSEPPRGLTIPVSPEDAESGEIQLGFTWENDLFGRVTSLSWSSDRWFLVAAIGFGVAGLAAVLGAARER